MSDAIVTQKLHKRYPPDTVALAEVDLVVPAGSIFALLGPNGAGKSTLTRILCTLTYPDAGRAEVAGVDVIQNPAHVRRRIGVVGQKHGAHPTSTGRENLTLQGAFCGVRGPALACLVSDLLERFGLGDAANREVRTYSGGMTRRLDIAMGLINQPEVLFLDEPTTGLDPEARTLLWEIIAGLSRDHGITVWLTTHYMEEADRLATEVAIVDRGVVVAQGSPVNLKRQLSGDALTLVLSAPDAPAAMRAAASVDDLDDVRLDGCVLRARTADGPKMLPRLLAVLESHGVTATSVDVARPSLSDVYSRHACGALAPEVEL